MIVSYFFDSVKVISTKDCDLESVLLHVLVFLVEHDDGIHETLGFDVYFVFVFGLRKEFSVVEILVTWVIRVDVFYASLLHEFSIDDKMKVI